MRVALLSLVISVVVPLHPIANVADAGGAGPSTSASASAGVWPSDAMIDAALREWAGRRADAYGLDDGQRKTLERRVRKRWRAFFDRHRDRLQPLFNEFIESQIAGTPPDTEQATDWSRRALPLLRAFRRELDESHREMREVLSIDQRNAFARDVGKVSQRLDALRDKLRRWERGRFEGVASWEGIVDGAQPPGPDVVGSIATLAIEDELRRWETFAAAFVERYALDEAQGEAVRSILRECKARARDVRARSRARIARLEMAMETDRVLTEQRRREIEAVYGPFDAIFAELKERVEQIPTAAQRSAARGRGDPTSAGSDR